SLPSPYLRPPIKAPPASSPRMYPLGWPHWFAAFSTTEATPLEMPPKKWWPASMISSDEYRAAGGGCTNAGEASDGNGGGTVEEGSCAPAGAAAKPKKTVAATARRKATSKIEVFARRICGRALLPGKLEVSQ